MPFNWFGNQNPAQNPAPKPASKQEAAQDPQQNTPNSNPEPTGLDKFAALIQNENKGDGQGQQRQRTNVQELFKNEQFMQGLRSNLRNSLSSAISEDTKAKLAENDPSAFILAIQEVAEASYMQALQHGASLQDLVLNEKLEDVQSNTESLVGKRLQEQQYLSAIPQLQNPIVQLGVQSFMDKVREQNPTITPDELKSQLNEYISELGTELGAIQKPEDPKQDVDNGVDWLQELGMEPPPQS